MASSEEFKIYVSEQIGLKNITLKKMMGEYLIYYNNVLVGGIYDNRLLVKVTDTLSKYNLDKELPYENAKPMYYIEDIDNRELVKEIIIETYNGLKK